MGRGCLGDRPNRKRPIGGRKEAKSAGTSAPSVGPSACALIAGLTTFQIMPQYIRTDKSIPTTTDKNTNPFSPMLKPYMTGYSRAT